MIIIKTKQEQNILQIPKLKPLNLELSIFSPLMSKI